MSRSILSLFALFGAVPYALDGKGRAAWAHGPTLAIFMFVGIAGIFIFELVALRKGADSLCALASGMHAFAQSDVQGQGNYGIRATAEAAKAEASSNQDPACMDWRQTLAPELSSFPVLRKQILALCGTSPKAKEVVLACDEAFSNVVYYSGATAVDVCLHIANNVLVASIADDGTPFDPLVRNGQERDFEDLDMGGMGIMIIRETSDEVAYEYAADKNVLTMKFSL